MRAKEQIRIMTALELTVNEKKTPIARVPEESFDFLGYTIGRCYSVRTGRAFIWTTAFPQVNEGHLLRDRRDDAVSLLSETCSRSRWGNQSEAARLGKLLVPWSGEPSVPGSLERKAGRRAVLALRYKNALVTNL